MPVQKLEALSHWHYTISKSFSWKNYQKSPNKIVSNRHNNNINPKRRKKNGEKKQSNNVTVFVFLGEKKVSRYQ